MSLNTTCSKSSDKLLTTAEIFRMDNLRDPLYLRASVVKI
jgi:hypothetical protein